MTALAEASAKHATEPHPVYAELLSVWQVTRDPRVAALVEALGARIHPARKISGKTVTAKHEAWRDLATAGKPEDRSTLLAELTSFGAWDGAHERLRAIENWAPSPELSTALTKLLLKPPYPREDSLPFWETVLAMLVRTLDRRAADALELHLKAHPWPGSQQMIRIMRRNFTNAIRTLREDAPPPASLTKQDADALAELEAAYLTRTKKSADGPKDAASFLKKIAEAPSDDAMRLVFADWLLERGDPRGEFIQLQYLRRDGKLDAAGEKREAALLRKHRQEWMGRLADVTAVPHGYTFERGFQTRCVYQARYVSAMVALIGAQEWATIESLDLSKGFASARSIPKLVLDPVMRSLRVVRGLPQVTMIELLDGDRELPWEEVSYRLNGDQGPDELSRFANMPNLTRLTVTSSNYRPEDWSWMASRALLGRLRALTLQNGVKSFEAWRRIVTDQKTTLESLTIAPSLDPASGLWSLTLRRDPKRAFTRLEIEPGERAEMYGNEAREQILSVVRALPKGALTELTVHPTSAKVLDEKTAAALRAQVDGKPA